MSVGTPAPRNPGNRGYKHDEEHRGGFEDTNTVVHRGGFEDAHTKVDSEQKYEEIGGNQAALLTRIDDNSTTLGVLRENNLHAQTVGGTAADAFEVFKEGNRHAETVGGTAADDLNTLQEGNRHDETNHERRGKTLRVVIIGAIGAVAVAAVLAFSYFQTDQVLAARAAENAPQQTITMTLTPDSMTSTDAAAWVDATNGTNSTGGTNNVPNVNITITDPSISPK